MALKNNMAEKEINLSQTNRSLVSVIIPVYKVEPYLRQCVDSVLAQTYTDFEVILVDDGSPDGCPAICDEYAEKDSRVKVIHKENGGLSDARNAGMNIACGEYALFVDSDDFISKEFLENLLRMAEEYNLDIVEGKTVYYENALVSEVFHLNHDEYVFFNNDDVYEFYLKTYQIVSAWNKLIKRSLLSEVRFIRDMISEDFIWFYNGVLPLIVCAGYCAYSTYYYRQGNTLSITKQVSEKHYTSYKNIIETLSKNEHLVSKIRLTKSGVLASICLELYKQAVLNGSHKKILDTIIFLKLNRNIFEKANTKRGILLKALLILPIPVGKRLFKLLFGL